MIASISAAVLLAATVSLNDPGLPDLRGASAGGAVRAARLVDPLDRGLVLAQVPDAPPAPPPLIEAPPPVEDTPLEPRRGFGEQPAAADDQLTYDRLAYKLHVREVAAAAGAVFVFQVAVGVGIVGSLLLTQVDGGDNPAAFFAGYSGAILFGLTSLAWPVVAAWAANAVAPPGYRAGGMVKAGLFSFAASQLFGIVLAGPSLLVMASAFSGGEPNIGLLVGYGVTSFLLQYLAIGLGASYGLHYGPPRPRGLEPRAAEQSLHHASRRSPNMRSTPTERALAERRVPGLSLLALAF